jgi:ABC-type multidrug transport system fused ATPase/permease subunit
MNEYLGIENDIVIVVLLAAMVMMLIFILILLNKMKKISKNHKKMLGESGVMNLEQVIIDIQEKLETIQSINEVQKQSIHNIEMKTKQLKGNIGIHRYNAFADRGSDLSFSLAIVDDSMNGVVLSGLHTREETYVYGKPLEAGESTYALSPEEKQAINQAIKKI